MRIKMEYVWLDGYEEEQNLRSKTKIAEAESINELLNPTILPTWSFDGSSTKQSTGNNSDCILKPVRVVKDPQRPNAVIVLCEVLDSKGKPHITNTRHLISDDISGDDNWFGFEQEYVIFKGNEPLGFPKDGYPESQGRYYCGIGGGIVSGRKLAEEHLDVCLGAGLNITGINAEVMLGQWEYQLFGKGTKKVSDDLWISRYLLHRLAEIHNVKISLHPKPIKGDWNGSGMHVNFSTKEMRDVGGESLFLGICDTLSFYHKEHIESYGSFNEQRLTGLHETQHINKFSYGVSDRGASIRIPIDTANNWKGYLEDRRPSSNGDPYKITKRIMDTLQPNQ
mgnify:CR=1 FL=1|tara:strand:+ start:3316 stop:4329 length:1014 start_codon:yes stop_codon:yes gene_type:complete